MDTNERAIFHARLRTCAHALDQEGVGALGRLFDLTARRGVRYALAITGHQDDAEDAFQAAMVRVALHPRRLAMAGHPWAYLLRIVRNEVLNILRHRRPRTQLVCPDEIEAADNPLLDEDETRWYVQRTLRRLPSEQAEVVVLKIWEEMTFAEIAEMLGESPNTVASRYRYALDKLTRPLRPLLNEVWYE